MGLAGGVINQVVGTEECQLATHPYSINNPVENQTIA